LNVGVVEAEDLGLEKRKLEREEVGARRNETEEPIDLLVELDRRFVVGLEGGDQVVGSGIAANEVGRHFSRGLKAAERGSALLQHPQVRQGLGGVGYGAGQRMRREFEGGGRRRSWGGWSSRRRSGLGTRRL